MCLCIGRKQNEHQYQKMWQHFQQHQLVPKPVAPQQKDYVSTVEPQFNKVPRDWGNLFVISRVSYIKNLDLTNFWENKQNVHYIEA